MTDVTPDAGKSRMQIKVYLVCMRRNLPKPGEPNVEIIAARLTHSAAQSIVDTRPGTYIEKHVAVK